MWCYFLSALILLSQREGSVNNVFRAVRGGAGFCPTAGQERAGLGEREVGIKLFEKREREPREGGRAGKYIPTNGHCICLSHVFVFGSAVIAHSSLSSAE